MKIGIATAFYPSVGGVEALARLLADAFAAAGHQVTIMTRVAGAAAADEVFSYRIVRQPRLSTLVKEMARCDVVLHFGVMMSTGFTGVLTGVPAVISHQTWFERRRGWLLPHEWLKRRYSKRCANVIPSPALATEPIGKAVMIPNCYDADVFKLIPHSPRSGQLIFVGRLVTDKGVDLLLRALAQLRREAVCLRLSIVGDGFERANLERLVDELALRSQVTFQGRQPPHRVAAMLNQHQIMVVPSRWEEPFGIVALEGMACGCAVVASDGGGLRDIVAPFGSLFPRNDLAGLCAALRGQLQKMGETPVDPATRAKFLEHYQPARMVQAYLALLHQQAATKS